MKIVEHKLACKICDRLCRNNIVDKSKCDIIIYGSELVLSFLISIFLLLIVGVITNTFLQVVSYIIIFVFLRRFTGGYHASSYFKCKLVMITNYLFVIMSSRYTPFSISLFMITFILGLIIIFMYCPIENKNKPIPESKRMKFKLLSSVTYIVIELTGVYAVFQNNELGMTILFTVSSVVLLAIIAKIKERRVKRNDRSSNAYVG